LVENGYADFKPLKTIMNQFRDRPARGGGLGRVIRNSLGEPVRIDPIEQIHETLDNWLEDVISRVALKEAEMTTTSLYRKVALKPAVTMGYSWLTQNNNPKYGDQNVKYFTGELSDWINFCVKFTMKYGYGIFSIFTGQKSLQDLMDSIEE
jgi:hypothetical protein